MLLMCLQVVNKRSLSLSRIILKLDSTEVSLATTVLLNSCWTFNFYRASACNACRTRYCYGILSVCPSVQCRYCF